MFDAWGQGSNIKTISSASSSANMLDALENIENVVDKISPMNPYHSRETSLERNYKHTLEDGRGSRSSSQHRSPDNSQQSKPISTSQQNILENNPPSTPKPGPPQPQQMSSEQLEQLEFKINILEEFIIDCYGVSECDEGIHTSVVPSALSKLVSDSSIRLLKRSKIARYRTGNLFAHFIKRGTLSIDDYCNGLKEVLSQIDDLRIDIPGIWDYLAEIIAPVLYENAVSLAQLRKPFEIIKQGHVSKLLESLFKLLITEKGPSYVHSLWHDSGLNLSDFMESSEVNNFIQENQLNFLLGGTDTVLRQMGQGSPSNTSGRKVYDKDFLLALKNDPKSRKKPENLLQTIAQGMKSKVDVINKYPMPGKPTDFRFNFNGSNYSGKSFSTKVNTENDSNIIEFNPGLPYKEGQWSPSNTSGKKVYDKDFLLALKNDPKSRKKPDNLLETIAQEEKGKVGDVNRYPMGGKPTDFTPNFSGSNYSGKSLSTQRSPQMDEPLGFSQMFGTWGRGSNIKTNSSGSSSGNMFAALENIGNDVDKRSPMNPYHSKGTSLERNYKHTFEDGRGSRSSSQHRPHDNSQRSKPISTSQQNIPKNNPPSAPKPRPPQSEQISPEQLEQLERKIKNILEEYLNDCYTVNECDEDIRTSLAPSALSKLVSDSSICVLERSKTARLGTGNLFAHLIKRGTLSLDNYCNGLKEVLSQTDDLRIDIPRIWDYLAEIIAPVLYDNAVSLAQLRKPFEIIKQGHVSKLLESLFKLLITEKGPSYVHSLWHDSGLNLSDFMESSEVNNFIQENQLNFLLGGTDTVLRQMGQGSPSNTSGRKVYDKDFLLALKNDPKSRKKPENLLQTIAQGMKSKVDVINNYPMPGKPTDFRFNFNGSNYSGKSFSTKVNTENDSNIIEFNPGLPYKEGQWSPSNTSGKKVYDKDFLLALKNDPKRRKKPDNLLETIAQEEKGKVGDVNRYPMGGKPTALSKLVSDSSICVLERSKTARLGTGNLFAHLIKRGTLSLDNYCNGLKEVLSQTDDLRIDIPRIWDYLAEIIAPVLYENAVSLAELRKPFEIIKQGHVSKLLESLFKLLITEKGPSYVHSLWHDSGLNLSDFMESSEVNNFIQENQLNFLLGGTDTVLSQSKLTYEEIHKKLLEFFANDNSFDDICLWIQANIGERINEKQFVRTLATAVFEDSIVKSKLKTENLRKHYTLLIRIVDGHPDYELECLYALQALINRLEHPQGILLSICGFLYDDNILSQDSFVKWESSDNPAEQEGKGKNKLDEIFVCDDSHPASRESSARQTPQPSYIPNKEVQNTFTKQVNMVINQDKMEEMEHSSSPSIDQHIDTQPVYQSLSPNPQAVHISNRIDIMQSSKLQTLPKRNSQQGKSDGNPKASKSSNEIRSTSVRGNVKLDESENIWKPARFMNSANMSDDEKKTQELYKKVRGVLNKLTPQKFEALVRQVTALPIDTKERLSGVVDLIFEKAIHEPNFSDAYAHMCRQLALLNVPCNSKKEGDSVNFRKLLITRCQLEFEKNSVDETARNAKLKEIEECTDPEKKKELQLLLEDYDRRIRRKSVGNVKFIGELFKQQMLTVGVMTRCLTYLLDNKEEESLECLCKLLSTIGKELEEKSTDLSKIFSVIREIVDKKHGKISNRVRFLLQDVIDLRNSKWVPRHQDLNSKIIGANVEQLYIQVMNAVTLTPRKDYRSTSGSGTGKRGARNTSDQEGLSTQSSRGRATFTVQSDKLKNKTTQMDEPLGFSQMFGTCGRGSNIKTNSSGSSSGNMFAALENIGNDVDKRSPMNPYHSRGTSLERNYKHTFEDGRGSRSSSQHRPHDNSQRSKPISTSQQNLPKNNPPSAPKPRPPRSEQISPEQLEQLERKIKNILEEYLNDCYTVNECDEDIRTSLAPSALSKLVSDSSICVLERSKTARLGTGNLFAHLIKRGTLSLDNYCNGLKEVLSQTDDLRIDIPRIWDYLAEIIAPVLYENAVSLAELRKPFEIIKQGHVSKLLESLFKLLITEKGPSYVHSLWHDSGLNLSDFMESSEVNNFIQENQLNFLLEGTDTILNQSKLTYEEIHKKLLEFFANDNSVDDIYLWIQANIGKRINEKQFVRTLATAVFEDSIVTSKLKTENLRKHYTLLIRIVDGHPDYELECLYALQALINRLEHPQGILLSICGFLYDDNVLSRDSFKKWESSDNPAEQEGKGAVLKQLTSFFTQLTEVDEETSSTEEA